MCALVYDLDEIIEWTEGVESVHAHPDQFLVKLTRGDGNVWSDVCRGMYTRKEIVSGDDSSLVTTYEHGRLCSTNCKTRQVVPVSTAKYAVRGSATRRSVYIYFMFLYSIIDREWH